jgi:hypothetical protein
MGPVPVPPALPAAAQQAAEIAPAIDGPDYSNEGHVKTEIEPVASSVTIDVDDATEADVVKLDVEEAATLKRALEAEQVLLDQKLIAAVASQQELQQRRSKRLKMYDQRVSQSKCATSRDFFMCPRCYYPCYYPQDERACNKLRCGNDTRGISFCIMCSKPASASCLCISAAWAR